MTNIIIGERCSGKTTRLIERSAKEQIYILTSTKTMARAIFEKARDMELSIPYPITVEEYFHSNMFQGSLIRRDGLLIDDADLIFQQIFLGIPIHEVTMTNYGNMEHLKSFIKEE